MSDRPWSDIAGCTLASPALWVYFQVDWSFWPHCALFAYYMLLCHLLSVAASAKMEHLRAGPSRATGTTTV